MFVIVFRFVCLLCLVRLMLLSLSYESVDHARMEKKLIFFFLLVLEFGRARRVGWGVVLYFILAMLESL